MSYFSWLDCKTQKPILNNVSKSSFLLIPKEFGGGHIEEPCYQGDGIFNNCNVFELIAEWNKEMIPQILGLVEKKEWKGQCSSLDIQNLIQFYNNQALDENYQKQYIGITMACYDEDNLRLSFPIKITYDSEALYEDCAPSNVDLNYGMVSETQAEEIEWQENLLWNLLKEHIGHKVEIVAYGDIENPYSITLEDSETKEIILDASLYTLRL